MFTVHVISDLNLQFNEFTPESDKSIPDVDLVVLNGNIGTMPKRGQLYVEELCTKYPTTQFVYNPGFSELYPPGFIPKSKYGNEIFNAIKARTTHNKFWPKNLHCFPEESKRIVLRNGHVVDVFSAFGYPKIYKLNCPWEETIWFKNIVSEVTRDFNDPRAIIPKETSKVSHGDLAIWATQEWMNEQNEIEYKKIRDWELTYDDNSGYKILITHINPIKDSRCKNQVVDFFNIHLNEGLWIGSDTKVANVMYVGAKFVSNPGRGEEARSLVIEADRR